MGNIGDTFTDAVPAVGTSGTAYASSVNALLTEMMLRLSTDVPVSSIAAADTSLDMNSQAILSAGYLQLAAGAGVPSGAPYGRFARYSGNVYWVDAFGAVQITNGAGLNAAAIGGIVGDYGGGNPAKVAFVDATETYEFYDDQSLTDWALLKCRGVDVLEETNNYVTSLRRAAGGASHTLTLPENNPASTALMACTAAGQLQSAGTAAVAEAFSMSNYLTFTGTAGVKHGTRTILGMTMTHASVIGTFGVVSGRAECTAVGGGGWASANFAFPMPPIVAGSTITITRIFCRLYRTATAGTSYLYLNKMDNTGGSTLDSQSTAAAGPGYTDITKAVSVTLSGVADYFIQIRVPSVGDAVVAIELDYTVT